LTKMKNEPGADREGNAAALRFDMWKCALLEVEEGLLHSLVWLCFVVVLPVLIKCALHLVLVEVSFKIRT